MLRYIGNIIADCREQTGETDYSDTNGIPQSVPILEANYAQLACQSIICEKFPEFFQTEEIIDIVANQTAYEIPENAWNEGFISEVWYSSDGQSKNYRRLAAKSERYRQNTTGEPQIWYQEQPRRFIIDPYVQTAQGKLRAVYAAAVDSVDLRRGKITAVTKNGPMTHYESITLSTTDGTLDETQLSRNEYICVNTVPGIVEYYNILYDYTSGYNTTSKVLTFSSPVPVSAGTITVGSYVTCGRFTTTHSKLGPLCEPVISAYINRRFYLGKSSTDASNEEDNISVHIKNLSRQMFLNRSRAIQKPRYTGKFE